MADAAIFTDFSPPHRVSSTARGGAIAPIVDVVLPLPAQRAAARPAVRPAVAPPAPPAAQAEAPRGIPEMPRMVATLGPTGRPLVSDPPSSQVRMAGERPTGIGDPKFAAAIERLVPHIGAVERAQLASVMYRREVAAGEQVYSAQTPTHAAWLVASGMLRVEFDDANGNPQGIGAVEAGTLVGAEALFGLAHHLGAVVAASDAVVYELSPARMELLDRVVPATAQLLLVAIHTAVARQQRSKIVRLERTLASTVHVTRTEPVATPRTSPFTFISQLLGQPERP